MQTKGKANLAHKQLKQQLPVLQCPEGPGIMSPPVRNQHAFSHFVGGARVEHPLNLKENHLQPTLAGRYTPKHTEAVQLEE